MQKKQKTTITKNSNYKIHNLKSYVNKIKTFRPSLLKPLLFKCTLFLQVILSIGIFGKVTNSTWSQNSNSTNWNNPSSWSAVAASPTVGQSCQRTTYTYDPKKKNCKFKYECKKTCKSVSKKECKKQLACTTFKKEKCETIQQTVCRGGDRLKRRRLRVKRDLEEKTRRRHKRTILIGEDDVRTVSDNRTENVSQRRR